MNRSLKLRRNMIHSADSGGQVRAMLLALERRLDAKTPVTHNVSTWLVEHAANILNAFAVGIDGRTAYGKFKGKKVPWSVSGEEQCTRFRVSPRRN